MLGCTGYWPAWIYQSCPLQQSWSLKEPECWWENQIIIFNNIIVVNIADDGEGCALCSHFIQSLIYRLFFIADLFVRVL